jgi:hypothetical protein
VRLPKAELAEVTESGKVLSSGDGIGAARQDGEGVVVEIASGQYRFSCPMPISAQNKTASGS